MYPGCCSWHPGVNRHATYSSRREASLLQTTADVEIWADEHISQMLHTKTVKFLKFCGKEWKKVGKGVSAQQRHQYIKVQDHSVQIVFSSGAAYIFVPIAGLVVFSLLQDSDGINPRSPLLGHLGSAVLVCIRMRLSCSRISKQTKPNGKTPSCFWTTSTINLGGKTPLDSSPSMRMVSWSHSQAPTSSGP